MPKAIPGTPDENYRADKSTFLVDINIPKIEREHNASRSVLPDTSNLGIDYINITLSDSSSPVQTVEEKNITAASSGITRVALKKIPYNFRAPYTLNVNAFAADDELNMQGTIGNISEENFLSGNMNISLLPVSSGAGGSMSFNIAFPRAANINIIEANLFSFSNTTAPVANGTQVIAKAAFSGDASSSLQSAGITFDGRLFPAGNYFLTMSFSRGGGGAAPAGVFSESVTIWDGFASCIFMTPSGNIFPNRTYSLSEFKSENTELQITSFKNKDATNVLWSTSVDGFLMYAVTIKTGEVELVLRKGDISQILKVYLDGSLSASTPSGLTETFDLQLTLFSKIRIDSEIGGVLTTYNITMDYTNGAENEVCIYVDEHGVDPTNVNDIALHGFVDSPFSSIKALFGAVEAVYTRAVQPLEWPQSSGTDLPLNIIVSGNITTDHMGPHINCMEPADTTNSETYDDVESFVAITGTGKYPQNIYLNGKGSGTLAGTINGASHARVLLIKDDYNVTIGSNITITGGDAGIRWGDGVYVKDAVFILDGGTITNNGSNIPTSPYSEGGGVYVDTGGKFTMKNGAVKNNTSHMGGGVFIAANAEMILEGGVIEENNASTAGGVFICANATMTGGIIKSNTANQSVAGVYLFTDSVFDMSGGSILDNKCTSSALHSAGGVLINASSATFNMTGGYIAGNIPTGITHASGGQFTMSGTAKVDINNVIYLDTTSNNTINITVPTALTHPIAGLIKPSIYSAGGVTKQVLSGTTASGNTHFDVVQNTVPADGNIGRYKIKPDGYLIQDHSINISCTFTGLDRLTFSGIPTAAQTAAYTLNIIPTVSIPPNAEWTIQASVAGTLQTVNTNYITLYGSGTYNITVFLQTDASTIYTGQFIVTVN
jgi:hypothetical protein